MKKGRAVYRRSRIYLMCAIKAIVNMTCAIYCLLLLPGSPEGSAKWRCCDASQDFTISTSVDMYRVCPLTTRPIVRKVHQPTDSSQDHRYAMPKKLMALSVITHLDLVRLPIDRKLSAIQFGIQS